ncbi:hypothetical protein Tco_1174795 [Tanacetum coccineum]
MGTLNQYPLKESGIKFIVHNRVHGGNKSSTDQLNSTQQMMVFSLLTGTKIDIGEIIDTNLVTKLLKTPRKKDTKLRSTPSVLSKQNFNRMSSKVQPIESTDYMLSVMNHQALVSPAPSLKNIVQLVVTGPPNSAPKDGTRKSKLLPEGQNTDPKESEGNKQPADMGLLSTSDEGINSSQLFPEGNRLDAKDSEGNLHPTDIESAATHPDYGIRKSKLLPEGTLSEPKDLGRNIQLTDRGMPSTNVTYQSRSDTKYQVDNTQSTQFEVLDPNHKKDKTSSEVEPDTQPPFQSLHDFEFLMEDSEDDPKELSNEEVYEARDEMEYTFPLNTEVQSQPPPYFKKVIPTKEEPHHEESSHHVSPTPDDSHLKSSKLEKHEEVVASYADLKMEIAGFHDATYRANENTDTTLRNYKRILAQFKTQNAEGINKFLTLVKELDFPSIKSTIESLLAAFTAQNDHLAKWAKSFASMAWSVGPRMTRIENTQVTIQSNIASLKTDTADIKATMNKIFYAFRGQPFSAHFGSVLMPTLALTRIPTIGGEKVEEKKETPSRPKGEQADIVTEEHKEEKVTDGETQDPDALILIDYEIDGIMHKITHEELHDILDKKEQMEQAVKEIELSKPEIKKVVVEVVNEAEVQIKGNKDLLKHQNAHLKVLTRAHHEKMKKKVDLRKKRFDQYVWTLNNRFRHERITDIFIHPNTKPVSVTVYRNNDPRHFHVPREFKFTERLKKIPQGLGLDESLPLPEQNLSLPKKKRKAIELEPETYIAGLHSFQRVNDVHNVETGTLLGYKVMVSNVKTNANQRFSMLVSKMINDKPVKERILSKRVKLESLGYTDV